MKELTVRSRRGVITFWSPAMAKQLQEAKACRLRT